MPDNNATPQSDTMSNLSFAVKWKNLECPNKPEYWISAGRICAGGGNFSSPETRNWDSMKELLKGKRIGAIRATYFDGEGDEIPIESQCEFEEFLKYCQKNNDTEIIIETLDIPEDKGAKTSTENFEKDNSAVTEIIAPLQHQIQSKMAPKKLDVVHSERTESALPLNYNRTQQQSAMASSVLDFTEYGRNAPQSQLRYNVTQSESSEETAPKWFTNYMQVMKDEMVTVISQRVTKTVIDALNKKRESQYDSASSNPHASDSEYVLDSDFEDRANLAEQTPYFSKNREKYISECCSRSGGYRFESARRNYRHTSEKQRKKHSKNHSKNHSFNHTPNSEGISHSPSFNRRRGEKIARNKREIDEARALPRNTGRSELISLDKTVDGDVGSGELLGEELNPSYRRTLASGLSRSSSTPTDSTDILEAPILKLRLANPYNEQPKEEEEKIRMGCSVTGEHLLDRPNDRVPEYCALSDSDNISIISDVSHTSDKLRMTNGFEMILQRSWTLTDEAEDDIARIITTDIQVPLEPEDPDNTRDSSSFELLSEPPPSPPPLSIHMDEDHFAPTINETSNYNINDETTIDKRGNQSKIDKCPYAIDAHGKIYQQNIMDGGEECADIVLEKRTGGAYSFVGEALPAPTKESIILVGNLDSIADQTFATTTEIIEDAEVEEATEEAINEPVQPRGNFHNAFHDSTQSFHSHTAPKPENYRQDSAAAASQSNETSRSHVFVDRNASKGLGDTKQSSPKKQTPTGDKSSEDSSRSERTRSNRRSSQDSHGSANRNNNSRHDPRYRRLGNWSATCTTRMYDDLVLNAVDPMHILPETLVTGAVHVASSAYITARRVYDKILTAQMKKPADRSQSKFGRR